MVAEMEFCLLGPMVVRHGGVAVPVPPGKQRAMLAALLLDANRVVTVDELAETLWGPREPPPSARATIQNYVKRLRQALGDPVRARISTQPRGYVIQIDAGELDVSRSEALLGAARAAAREGSWGQAAAQARAALSLWRGEPLADVESDVLALREVPRLAEMHLQALEARIDADLHLGRHADVIIELQRLAGAHPLREQLHALLMLALYRCDRQADALAAYQHARGVLIEELGAEPATGLRELHQQMLTADPALAVPEPAPPAAGGPAPVAPRELPGTVRQFTGRDTELTALTGLLEEAGEKASGTVVISAIGGTAGVGKTALAVHWAHQVAERFPDGQLYVNLRGYDPGQPMPAADALARFLRTLGVPGQEIPAEEDESAARYRSLLAGRRMLVVLDNAGSAEQVRPLLPGSPACMTVVTSRDSLAGLVARDGATRLDLDLLPLADAVSLLRALIGERADADPVAAEALAARCCRLPLALRIAAELAAARPAAPLARLVGELADQQRRLDLLDADGDARTAVRAVFSWSCRHLDPDAASAFRLACLHPGPDLGRYAIAALTGATLEQAERMLGVLAQAHLIQPAGPGRHGMHDLLRTYARELTGTQDTYNVRYAALTRLFDHYLHAAAAAMDALFPAERHLRPRIPASPVQVPPVTDPGAARAWLDGERATLVAVAAYASEHCWPGHATRIAAVLSRYLDTGGHFPEAISIHTHACRAARENGDHAAEANALNSLGLVDWWQGRYQDAADRYQQALVLFRKAGDRAGQARALNSLGVGRWWVGRLQDAVDCYEQALALFREVGDRAGQARALSNIALIDLHQGRYQEADDYLRQTLVLHRGAGDLTGEGRSLNNLGLVELRQGRYQQARGHIEQALALCRETGDRGAEAHVLATLGDVDLRQDRHEDAAAHFRQALVLCREIGDGSGESVALNGLGEVLLATGKTGEAREQHASALSVAAETGEKYEQARAHNGLARSYHATGEPGQARRHWQEALTIYTSLGAPEADQVRALLATAADHARSEALASSRGLTPVREYKGLV